MMANSAMTAPEKTSLTAASCMNISSKNAMIELTVPCTFSSSSWTLVEFEDLSSSKPTSYSLSYNICGINPDETIYFKKHD